MKRSDWIIAVLIILCAVLMFNVLKKQQGLAISRSQNNTIGIVKIEGTILNNEPILEDLDEIASIRDLKALILHINSPGGGAAASQELYYAVKRIKQKYGYPIVAVLTSVGASGGYYVAQAADSIYALPGTLTGSIGVIMDFPQWLEMMEKIGVNVEVVKSGKYKDTGSPYREFTQEDRQYYQQLVNDVYDQFIMAVSESRELDINEVKTLADGRIFTGRQAYKLGLIDHLGTEQDAIEALTRQLELKDTPAIVRPKKDKLSLYRIIFGDVSRWVGSILPTPTPQMIYK
ncbi:MAG: signal peptide peptidase SppA [Candidatus Marinimicrobia bacterium]|nr:signal peptide peptidase SppA [Candidatus Neomarinimicrobiota bacterium]